MHTSSHYSKQAANDQEKKVKKGNELKKIWQMAMEYLPTHACMEMQRGRVNVAGLQSVEATYCMSASSTPNLDDDGCLKSSPVKVVSYRLQ